MIKFTFLIAVFSLLTSCSPSGSRDSDASRINALTIAEVERTQPMTFLAADEICMSGFGGNEINVHGVIKNTSPTVSYKDAVVKVIYYDNTNKELGNKEYTINVVFPPLSDVRVELKVVNHKEVATIDWEVIQATAN